MAQPASVFYGAFELKRTYQRNMLMGTLFSAGLTAFCILSVWLYNVITYEELEARNVVRIKTIAELGAPPSLAAKPPQVSIDKPNVAAPKVGIPTPVAVQPVLTMRRPGSISTIASTVQVTAVPVITYVVPGGGQGDP